MGRRYGATVVRIDGTYDELNRLCLEVADEEGWAFVNVNLRPFYAEGSKTLGYETAVVLFDAIQRAGSLDHTKVRDALASTNLTGQLVVGGTVKFKDNGQIDNAYLMTQNLPNQKVALIYPKELATTDAMVPLPKQ